MDFYFSAFFNRGKRVIFMISLLQASDCLDFSPTPKQNATNFVNSSPWLFIVFFSVIGDKMEG